MTEVTRKKLGVGALVAITLVIAVILLKALVGGLGGKPSEREVRAACAGGGTGAAIAVAKIKASGEAKAAAAMATAMGFAYCEGVFH